jgi:hypothetical protein
MNEVSIRRLSQDDLTDRDAKTQTALHSQRPQVKGKFLYVNGKKILGTWRHLWGLPT